MKKLTRRVFVLACAAVLTVSSIPISAEELGGASENADMSELGAAAGCPLMSMCCASISARSAARAIFRR
mgnify:CR=1 FL=1